MSDLSDAIHDYAMHVMAEERAFIEEACEKALLSGKYGVFVLRNSDGRLHSAGVHPYVPYGQIYEAKMPLVDGFWDTVRSSQASERDNPSQASTEDPSE